MNEKELIRSAMAALGSRKSEKKRLAAIENAKRPRPSRRKPLAAKEK